MPLSLSAAVELLLTRGSWPAACGSVRASPPATCFGKLLPAPGPHLPSSAYSDEAGGQSGRCFPLGVNDSSGCGDGGCACARAASLVRHTPVGDGPAVRRDRRRGGGHGTTLGWVFPAPVASRSESPLWGRQGGGRRGSQLLLLPCRILLPSQV